MSVINKKEFFLIWTKQTIKNIKEKFLAVFENTLAKEILKENLQYLNYSSFIQTYGDAKVTSQLLTNPQFMLDLLIITNAKEFYTRDDMDYSEGTHSASPDTRLENSDTNQYNSRDQIPSNRGAIGGRRPFNCFDLTANQSQEIFEHLLQLIKAFFKKRMLDGKNLFKVLQKCCEQDDIRWKIFELLFLVCFFCKDIASDLDFYYLKDKNLNIFNNSCNQLHQECNPMLIKCIFQVVGDALKQFTLIDVDQYLPFLGQEEIFMRKAHKINLNEDSMAELSLNNKPNKHKKAFSHHQHIKGTKNEYQIGQSFLGTTNNEGENTKVLTTQPSVQFKDLSIDTFNLTPMSSNHNTPRQDTTQDEEKQKPIKKGKPKKYSPQKFGLKTIQSLQDEEDNLFKVEELENQVFTLQSENMALKKNLEVIENELVKSKEKEELQEYEKQELDQDVQQMSQELKEMKFRNQEIEFQNSELLKNMDHYHHLQENLSLLKSDNSHLQQINLAQQSELQFLNNQTEELQSQIEKKEKDNNKITRKYQKLKNNVTTYDPQQNFTQISYQQQSHKPYERSKSTLLQEFSQINQSQPQPAQQKKQLCTQSTQVQEEQLGIFISRKLEQKQAECKELKSKLIKREEKLIKREEKLSFLKEKSIRQDDSIILHDMKLKKTERITLEQSEQLQELDSQFNKLKDKYKDKRRELKFMKKEQSKQQINPNLIATIFFSLVFAFVFSRMSN